MNYRITPLGKEDSLLPELMAHLDRVGQREDFPDLADHRSYAFAAWNGVDIVGHISMLVQTVELPDWPLELLTLSNHSFAEAAQRRVEEGFVQTFAIEAEHRRHGLGLRLQQAAIEQSRRYGLYQMRSWSSLDKAANFNLKLALGFAVCPGYYYVAKHGKWVPGVWFVMKL